MSEYYIIDNWYESPNNIRDLAIDSLNKNSEIGREKQFGLRAFPGYRTNCPLNNLLINKEKIEKETNLKIDPKRWIFQQTINLNQTDYDFLEYDFDTNELKIKNSDLVICDDNTISNGSFQYCTRDSKTWVHADKRNDYAAVVYLHPNPPSRCGTAFYKHKRSKKTHEQYYDFIPVDEILNPKCWEEIDYVENVYNRCVIYNAKQFHTATGYFGDIPENSRLFQVFFFNILS
jgi:hypothetical protein